MFLRLEGFGSTRAAAEIEMKYIINQKLSQDTCFESLGIDFIIKFEYFEE